MAHGQEPWPDLATPGWLDTCRGLHLRAQVLGKTRLVLAPMMNHWWQATMYVSARGLSTSPMPYGNRSVEAELDLVAHRLEIRTSEGGRAGFPLAPGTVAAFHARFFEALRSVGVEVRINPIAAEIPETIHLDRDAVERPYDAGWAGRFFTALVQLDRVFKEFRAGFLGKASPVHFFWGSFDLAVSRFSGRRAPAHPAHAPHTPGDMMREAYSHEVSSAGFRPGDAAHAAALYACVYPEPAGFARARVEPAAARWDAGLREFLLPWDAVRAAPSPDRAVLSFLESTYAAGADLGGWPRADLERPARRRAGPGHSR